jgi:hypothetical protein
MNDVFIELLIKKEKGPKEWAAAGAVSAAVLACAAAFAFLGGLALIATALIGFAVYYALTFLNVEYEYCFTNGELDIDCIYSKSRRKRKFSCDIKSAEIFCRADNKTALEKFSRVKSARDFSSGAVAKKGDTYAFIVGDAKIIIEPDERLLAAVKKYLTPRVLIL